MNDAYKPTFEYKLIYVFQINDELHKGLLKIGDTKIYTNNRSELFNNCEQLNRAAKERINSYTKTASIDYELLHTELAINNENRSFRDWNIHQVLERSNIKKHDFKIANQGKEWFKVDLETVKKAIQAYKDGYSCLNPNEIIQNDSPIIFRPEQKEVIKWSLNVFKNHNQMLWNAKMRFGKTLTSLEFIRIKNFEKTLIITHRPVVRDGWFEDFQKIFKNTNFQFGSKQKGETIEYLEKLNKPYIYFASLQDLRGSEVVGGNFDKNEKIFAINWDFVIIDEAHEGTQTILGQAVLDTILSNNQLKKSKLLKLSGTPFNLLQDFDEQEVYTWDYIKEQTAKENWPLTHFGDSNPYEDLPKMEIYTFNLDKLFNKFSDENKAFNFNEFFRTWTGDIEKDFKPLPNQVKIGEFVHQEDVQSFLNLLTKYDINNNFPFATQENRDYFRHTLWIVPGVKEAKALSALLKNHQIFGSKQFYKIVNVAGEGDEEINANDAYNEVLNAIGDSPDSNYTITISCGRLTTGVTVKPWTAVFMLSGTTSATTYLQTIFRVQSPANINGKMKTRCAVFDFAPDRTLKIIADYFERISDESNNKKLMGQFLNYCPIISVFGSKMKNIEVEDLIKQLNQVYIDKIIKSGFESKYIYNIKNLKSLDEADIELFKELDQIMKGNKLSKPLKNIDINNQGFDKSEYEELQKIKSKPEKELSDQEKAILEENKRKNEVARKRLAILTGISVRFPMLIYGANIPIDKEITVQNFPNLIDEKSWEEFMPKNVTKAMYYKFIKYYHQDRFILTGRQIRQMTKEADQLPPTQRVQKIAEIFGDFKNPDKETVLTPWKIVNMHMGDCLGGYNFYDKEKHEFLEEPIQINHNIVSNSLFKNMDTQILEINSKTGLYPLYIAYSIFRNQLNKVTPENFDENTISNIWKEVIKNNIYIICKTQMALQITKRTLLGYHDYPINIVCEERLIDKLNRNSIDIFKDKVLTGKYWNKENIEMKFDAIIGNPPYQILDGGAQASARPVYNLFVEFAKLLNPNFISFIMPSRWMTGGKGLDEFREKMINDKQFLILHDYFNSKDCFPNVDIKGGVCYFLWNNKVKSECEVYTHLSQEIIHFSKRYFLENEYKIFIRDNQMIPILNKVVKITKNFFSSIVSARKPYGLSGDFFKDPSKYGLPAISNNPIENGYQILGLEGNKRIFKYIPHGYPLPKNDMLKEYKIFITRNYGVGEIGEFPSNPVLAIPGELCTETFIQIGPFKNKDESENALNYFKTKFFRLIVSIVKQDQGASREIYRFVPIQDFTNNSDIDWSEPISKIDYQLYKKYNLSPEDINFIESTISTIV